MDKQTGDVGHIAQTIDDELHRRARMLALGKGQTFKAWVEDAIREKADRQEADEAKRRRR